MSKVLCALHHQRNRGTASRQETFVILIEGNEFVIGSYRFETLRLPDLTRVAIKRPLARSHGVWVCVHDSLH